MQKHSFEEVVKAIKTSTSPWMSVEVRFLQENLPQDLHLQAIKDLPNQVLISRVSREILFLGETSSLIARFAKPCSQEQFLDELEEALK